MAETLKRPPFDPELEATLTLLADQLPGTFTPEMIPLLRQGAPGIYHTHGGGMIIGDRFVGLDLLLGWITDLDAVVVTVEYRLAPEFPDPYPVRDCYAGLVWTAEHAEELGIDSARLIIAGGSAGGGRPARDRRRLDLRRTGPGYRSLRAAAGLHRLR